MRTAWWVVASAVGLAMGLSGVVGQKAPGLVPTALDFEVPTVRLSPPPVAVAGVKTCEFALTRAPAKASWEPARVTIPQDWAGKRAKLFIEYMPEDKPAISVNGTPLESPLGAKKWSYEVDVTGTVLPGKENTFGGNSLGLRFGRSKLRALPSVNLSLLEVDTTFDARFEDATMEVMLGVANESAADASNLEVVFELIGPKGAPGEIEPTTYSVGAVMAGQTVERVARVLVRRPAQWDHEHPNLYFLKATLTKDGTMLETARRRFGFRQVELRGNELFINNRPVKLRGAVSFWACPGLKYGSHPYVEDARRSLLMVREANANHVRGVWNAPVMTELCDELGITTVPELPFWNSGDLPTKVRSAAYAVATHRSTPSAIMWSIANESRWDDTMKAAGLTFQRLDQRPVGMSSVHIGKGGQYPELDFDTDHYPNNRQMTEQVKNGRPWYYDEFCHTSAYSMTMDSCDYGVVDQWGDMFEENWEGAYNTRGVIGVTLFAFYGFGPSDGRNNPLDRWMRPTASYWHVKKAYCPVRIKEAPLPVPEAGKPLRIEADISIEGQGFSWRLDRKTGLVRSGRAGDREVVVGGPALYLGGPLPRDVADMASWGTCTDWTPSNVKVTEGADGVTVTAEGVYKAAKGHYALVFDGAGGLEVRYDFVHTGPNPTGHRASGYREVGVLLEVSGKCDMLRWQRRAKWTTYPDDHIGRPEGTARLSRMGGWPLTPEKFLEAQTAEWESINQLYRTGAEIPVPDWPWAHEEGPNGTHDFGSTKYNIYHASLAGADGMGLRVESDGSQHARCKIRGDHVDFVVNDFSGSSYQSHLAWFKSIKKVLKEGDRIRGTARFRLVKDLATEGCPPEE